MNYLVTLVVRVEPDVVTSEGGFHVIQAESDQHAQSVAEVLAQMLPGREVWSVARLEPLRKA